MAQCDSFSSALPMVWCSSHGRGLYALATEQQALWRRMSRDEWPVLVVDAGSFRYEMCRNFGSFGSRHGGDLWSGSNMRWRSFWSNSWTGAGSWSLFLMAFLLSGGHVAPADRSRLCASRQGCPWCCGVGRLFATHFQRPGLVGRSTETGCGHCASWWRCWWSSGGNCTGKEWDGCFARFGLDAHGFMWLHWYAAIFRIWVAERGPQGSETIDTCVSPWDPPSFDPRFQCMHIYAQSQCILWAPQKIDVSAVATAAAILMSSVCKLVNMDVGQKHCWTQHRVETTHNYTTIQVTHTHTHIYIYMYMYVYMYICIYVYMCICVYVYMCSAYVSVFVSVSVYVHVHVHVYVYIYIYVYVYVNVYVNVYVYVYVNVYTCIYTYAHFYLLIAHVSM